LVPVQEDRMSIPVPGVADIAALKQEFETRGYAHARGLFTAGDIDLIREHFDEIHRTGAGGYRHLGLEEAGGDILRAYPRVMNPHRFSPLARRYFTAPAAAAILRGLLGEEPLGVQTMYYFKPPGARGQAMHQDQFYLQVRPGTCVACWIAVDAADRENGGMVMVPLTQQLAIDCRNVGKPGSYDAGATPVPIPRGYKGECPSLEAGDALFFNGSLLHGSGSNRSKDRWRRSFIGHYVGRSCDTISRSYHPLVTMSGEDVERGVTTDGGPCGGWVGAAH
jgi:ectoine hydroxylase-related dioxygenase (phytanoyl-CoA dioxygenase family)